jgi:hypothetical protein
VRGRRVVPGEAGLFGLAGAIGDLSLRVPGADAALGTVRDVVQQWGAYRPRHHHT